MLRYQKLFDPKVLRLKAPALEKPRRAFVADYEYDDSIVLAVNVALATGRPLLLRGDAGSGKSTLAEDVARLLHWRYYEQVVSSTVEAADLLWRMDHVGRIADAQAGNTSARAQVGDYVEPGVLWWAFAPEQARKRGLAAEPRLPARDPELRTWKLKSPSTAPAVVLLDEIDKAEPDFPNDLLVPLGSLSFQVRTSDVDIVVQAPPEMRPLVIVTTNEERDLPSAFLRRCVVLRLTVPGREPPGPERLKAIARQHFPEEKLDAPVLEALMERYFEFRDSAAKLRVRPPGTAEFLDAARAVVELWDKGAKETFTDFIKKNEWVFRELTQAALWKHRQLPPDSKP